MKISRRFFGAMVGGFLWLGGVWVGLFYAQLGGATKGSLAVETFRAKKHELAQAIHQPKILLVSGSNVLLGLRAEIMSQRLGLPVLNAAVHAGLGIDYTLYDARRLAQAGDTVILFFEYGQYNWDGEPSENLLDHVLANDLEYFHQLSWSEQWRYIFTIDRKRLERGLRGKYHPPELSPDSYQASDMNTFGDFMKNQEANRPANLSSLDTLCPSLVTGIKSDTQGWEKLRAFLTWARAHQVRVLASFPSLLWREEYRGAVAQSVFREVVHFYQHEQIPLLGRPEDFAYGRELFFDTYYHLTDVGAVRRTEDVLRFLQPILKGSVTP